MAGSVDVSIEHGLRYYVITVDWTADSADGSVPNTDLVAAVEALGDVPVAFRLEGWIEKIVTNPGTPAPTADYDITLEDPEGVDVLGGAGADRSDTDAEQAVPLVGSTKMPAFIAGVSSLTFKLAGNSVNSAEGRLVVYISR